MSENTPKHYVVYTTNGTFQNSYSVELGKDKALSWAKNCADFCWGVVYEDTIDGKEVYKSEKNVLGRVG